MPDFLKKPAFLLALTMSLVIALFIGHTAWLQVEINELNSHYYQIGEISYRLLYEIESLENLSVDMETGRRGYLLTGDRDFLEPYYSAKKGVSQCFSDLYATVDGKSPAFQKLEEIRVAITAWIDLAGEPEIVLRQNTDHGRLSLADPQRLNEEKAKEIMDGLRRDIGQFKRIIEAERQDRLARMRSVHQRVVSQIYFSVSAAILVIIFLGILLFREIRLIENKNMLLAEQERRLQVAVGETQAASRLKSEFLANMSHELRTPLNAVIGFAQVLQKQYYGPLTEKQSAYVDYILTGGRHLLGLINDILDLSKIEAGKMDLNLTNLSLPEVFQNCLLMVREKAGRRRIELSWKVAEDVLKVTADERKLKQIICNLLFNAVKFTAEGGKISLSARMAGDSAGPEAERHVEISVSDTGIGIPRADQKRIFKPFTQLEGGLNGKYEGTGLGLALVKSFVELHGGRVWVQSAGEGKGSTFYFTLPAEQNKGGAEG